MLEPGQLATIKELAAAEKINSSYVSRVLRLTLPAPDVIEAILDGLQPEGMTLPILLEPFPVEWQRLVSNSPNGAPPDSAKTVSRGESS
jgi:hypothetical protein